MSSDAPQHDRKCTQKRIRVWGKSFGHIELEILEIHSSGKVKETFGYMACGEYSGQNLG